VTDDQLEAVCEKLSIAMVNALQQARSVSDSEHYDHHLWVTQRIQREQARAKFWTAMLEHVAKWGSVSVLSCIFYAIWLYIKQEIRR
jgi:hypothetical protein